MKYFENIFYILEESKITDYFQQELLFETGIETIVQKLVNINKNKIMSIGNGGSAAIASHLTNDLCRMDHSRAVCFSDYSYITCMANDFGYENVYANSVEMFANKGDILVAISSSGNSENIIRAVYKARDKKCFVIGLSGFDENNKLRQMGDINIFIPKKHYGYVELSHQIILHMITDMAAENQVLGS